METIDPLTNLLSGNRKKTLGILQRAMAQRPPQAPPAGNVAAGPAIPGDIAALPQPQQQGTVPAPAMPIVDAASPTLPGAGYAEGGAVKQLPSISDVYTGATDVLRRGAQVAGQVYGNFTAGRMQEPSYAADTRSQTMPAHTQPGILGETAPPRVAGYAEGGTVALNTPVKWTYPVGRPVAPETVTPIPNAFKQLPAPPGIEDAVLTGGRSALKGIAGGVAGGVATDMMLPAKANDINDVAAINQWTAAHHPAPMLPSHGGATTPQPQRTPMPVIPVNATAAPPADIAAPPQADPGIATAGGKKLTGSPIYSEGGEEGDLTMIGDPHRYQTPQLPGGGAINDWSPGSANEKLVASRATYHDQVADAVRRNAANGMAPTAEQRKTLGMSSGDVASLLAANNEGGRFTHNIATETTLQQNEGKAALNQSEINKNNALAGFNTAKGATLLASGGKPQNKNPFTTFANGLREKNPAVTDAEISDAWSQQQLKLVGERGAAYQDNRQYQAFDTENGNRPTYVTGKDMKANPTRYAPTASTAKALTQTATIGEIRNAATNLGKSIDGLKTDFSAAQRGQFAAALKSRDPKSAMDNLMGSEWGKSLTPDQIDYVTDVHQMVESAMAMRTALGTGAGSDAARQMMIETVPGLATPSKAYAHAQLTKLESQLKALEKGIPNVKTRDQAVPPGGQAMTATGPNGHKIKSMDGGNTWLDAVTGQPVG